MRLCALSANSAKVSPFLMTSRSLLSLFHERFQSSGCLEAIEKKLESGKRGAPVRLLLSGPREADLSFITAGLHRTRSAPTLLVAQKLEPTERHYDDLLFFGVPSVQHYPAWETLPFEDEPLNLEVMAKRLDTLAHLAGIATGPRGEALPPPVVVAPVDALLQLTVPPEWLRRHAITVEWGQELDVVTLSQQLARLGFRETPMVEGRGEFSIRGGIIDLFSLHSDYPVRLDLFGREIESIRYFDLQTQRSLPGEDNKAVERVLLLPADERRMIESALQEGCTLVPLLEYFPQGSLMVHDAPETYGEMIEKFESLVQHEIAAIESGRFEWRDPRTGAPARPEPAVFFTTGSALLGRMAAYPTVVSTQLGIDEADMRDAALAAGQLCRDHEVRSRGFGDLKPEFDTFVSVIKARQHEDYLVVIVCDNEGQVMRFGELLAEKGIATVRVDDPSVPNARFQPKGPLEGYPEVVLCIGVLSSGFVFPETHLLLLTDREVFGRYRRRHIYRKIYRGTAIRGIDEIQRGDYVVHVEHGIGQFVGLRRQEIDGEPRDLIEILYKDDDRLLVPVDKVHHVQKYTAPEGVAPALDKLGGKRWQQRKKKSAEEIEKMAGELLDLYAERATAEGRACPPDNHLMREFEASFIYQETPDQLSAIGAVKNDLESQKPMDRLVCGDVGYGKTEVAIRAAFKAIQGGWQVALLCPTTILAQQHYLNFKERFADYPVSVELMSRFRTEREIKDTLKRVESGDCHLVIGTHRLLGKDVKFRNLGLLVIDEEQRFGVAHKERLKKLRTEIDVLTLTATPIPRTLYMALSGLRDMSLITTPPADRYPVKTRVIPFDRDRIEEAILRELNRGGQVYFVHNRVHNIHEIRDRLLDIVPQARIAIAHGQMNEGELEEVMVQFMEGKFDILLATTIIENGLDIANCNTIIVNRADAFGLAQLYQLRGRVGRSNRRSYAYLVVPDGQPVTEAAVRRLEAIQEFTELGVGFQIALRDMEIRGTGNILGAEQHGTMEAIGFELYCELLEEAVRRMKGHVPVDTPADVEVVWTAAAYIPGDYIPVESQRLTFYRKVAAMKAEAEIDAMEAELRDRYGPLPEPVANIMGIARLRVLTLQVGGRRLSMSIDGFKLMPAHNALGTATLWNRMADEHPGVEKAGWTADGQVNVRVKAWAKGRRIEKAVKVLRSAVRLAEDGVLPGSEPAAATTPAKPLAPISAKPLPAAGGAKPAAAPAMPTAPRPPRR